MKFLNVKYSLIFVQLVILFGTESNLFSQSNAIHVFFPDNVKGKTIENSYWSLRIISSNEIDDNRSPNTKTIYMRPSLDPNKFVFQKNDEVKAEILATFKTIGLKNFNYPKTNAEYEWTSLINGIEVAIIASGFSINFKEETKEEAIREINEESQLVELNEAPTVPTNSTKKPELSEAKQEEQKIISVEEDVKNQQAASKKALEKASNEEAKAKAMREKSEKDKKDIESK